MPGLRLAELNPCLKCSICDGYLINATTIVECLHSFCRTCIVQYLESSNFCPVCNVQVHETKPLHSIRSDQTLQDLVYKLVPGLYQNEMQKRREFYVQHPEAALSCSPEERGECDPRFISPKEKISISLRKRWLEESCSNNHKVKENPAPRYLLCPAGFTMKHVKKFLQLKFNLPVSLQIDLFYEEDLLRDDFTLIDVAYIYSWIRTVPMSFYYGFSKRSPKSSHIQRSKFNLKCDMKQQPGNSSLIDSSVDLGDKLNDTPSNVTDTQSENSQLSSATSKEESEHKPDQSPSTSSLFLPLPEPTYNSVKLISAPEKSTLLSPTNGFRLKFIKNPELNPKSQKLKKSGRKSSKNSEHKYARVKLARLAPYPSTTVPCLTPQFSQITVGKLVPSVITTTVASPNSRIASVVHQPLTCNVINSNPVISLSNVTANVHPATTQCNVTANVHPATTLCNVTANVNPITCMPNVTVSVNPVTSMPNGTASVDPVTSMPNGTASVNPVTSMPNVTASVNSSILPVQSTNKQSLSLVLAHSPKNTKETDENIQKPSRERLEIPECRVLISDVSKMQDSSFVDSPPAVITDSHQVPVSKNPTASVQEPYSEQSKGDSQESSVRDSITAEFSDSDDLGSLVVDEQKRDCSDNEDEALRKKITAIAEHEEEMELTDEVEADSGVSCATKSEDDATTEENFNVTSPSVGDSHRQAKSNSINDVIKNLYRQHEKSRPSSPAKETGGALDLSTCSKKSAECLAVRPRPVANPVLDIKHRQQSYLPAPMKQQHTTPKHSSSPLLLHHLTNSSSTSSSSSPFHPPPSPGSSFLSPEGPKHGRMGGLLPGMMPYASLMNLAYSSRSSIPMGLNVTSFMKDTTPKSSPGSVYSPKGKLPNLTVPGSPTSYPKAGTAFPSKVSMHPRSSLYHPSLPSVSKKKKVQPCHKNHKFRGSSNLAVYNPDPNGHRPKLVIKNLNPCPNNF